MMTALEMMYQKCEAATMPHTNVTRSVKTQNFSNSCLLNIYDLLSQMYSLPKFQLHMAICFGVTAL